MVPARKLRKARILSRTKLSYHVKPKNEMTNLKAGKANSSTQKHIYNQQIIYKHNFAITRIYTVSVTYIPAVRKQFSCKRKRSTAVFILEKVWGMGIAGDFLRNYFQNCRYQIASSSSLLVAL